jgi:large subunit ribosomal protein L10
MGSAKAKKQESLNSLVSLMSGDTNKTVVLVSFSRMSVSDMDRLRVLARECGATVKVAKRRLVSLALQTSNFSDIATSPRGHSAIICSDSMGAAVAVGKFNDRERLTLLAGVVEGKVVDGHGINMLSAYGSTEELYAHLLRLIRTPWVRVLRGIMLLKEEK